MTTHLTIEGGLATVVFDNPDTLNALGRVQIAEFNDVTSRIAQAPDVRVILLRAEGRAFGVGGDLGMLRPDSADVPSVLRDIGHDLNPAILRLRNLPAIVVACVHGAVAGGSMGMVNAADIVIASRDTTFNMAYARIGGSPDAGNSWFLPRLVGTRKALEWLLLSDNFDAETALAFGLVNQVVSPEELRAATDKLVARLLAGPHGSYQRIKRLVYQAETTPLARQLDDEIENFAQAAESADMAEGIAAFLEKRKPTFGKK
ncbi:enoyl-CoA hydratase [Herbaspirillum sp. HC18]|nr:enoyl-CoA hydratase [Herbaspirillum sp. HC18]